jgi:hypothetical protein
MADTIMDRNRVLEGVRFAGQQLLKGGTSAPSGCEGRRVRTAGQIRPASCWSKGKAGWPAVARDGGDAAAVCRGDRTGAHVRLRL